MANKTSSAQIKAVRNYQKKHKEDTYTKKITFYKKDIPVEMFEHCKMKIQRKMTFNKYMRECLLKFEDIINIVKED